MPSSSWRLRDTLDGRRGVKHALLPVRELVARQVLSHAKRSTVLSFRALMLASVPLLHAFDVLSEQLKLGLKKHHGKVLPLWQSWDIDGNGIVSRSEFHRALHELGHVVLGGGRLHVVRPGRGAGGAARVGRLAAGAGCP